MRLLIGSIFALFIGIGSLQAQTVQFINASVSAGAINVMSKEIIANLDKFNVNYRVAEGNCALAKNMWDSATGPVMAIIGTNNVGNAERSNVACFIEATRDNFVAPLWYGEGQFCAVASKGKTWEEFIVSGSRHVVGIPPGAAWENVMKAMARQYNLNLRIVTIPSSNQNRAMAQAGELDYAFRLSLNVFPEFKCFWSSQQLSSKFEWIRPQMNDLSFGLGEYYFVIAKNMTPADMVYARNMIRKATLGEQLTNLRNQRGHTLDHTSWTTEEQFNARREEFFNLYYEPKR